MRSTLASTRRRPLAAGVVLTAAAVAALGACTGSGSSDGDDGAGKSPPVAGGSLSPAPPGKYRTLPQPCTVVDPESLRKLVPGAADYAGTESLTYDTDRLVGCSWKGTTADGVSHSLTLSVVRVVSYDPGVSDEVQARTDFEHKATAASIPPSPPGSTQPTPSGTTTPGGTATGGTSDAANGGSPSAGDPGATTGTDGAEGPGSSPADLAPRRLSGVGNAAFINEVGAKPAGGAKRVVTLVFRTANVLATVSYVQSSPVHTPPPISADLQKDAEKVAGDLQHKVEG